MIGAGNRNNAFRLAAETAQKLGAKKLYISATPSERTVNYYLGLGCVLAIEMDPERLVLEPEDLHLEYSIEKQPPGEVRNRQSL